MAFSSDLINIVVLFLISFFYHFPSTNAFLVAVNTHRPRNPGTRFVTATSCIIGIMSPSPTSSRIRPRQHQLHQSSSSSSWIVSSLNDDDEEESRNTGSTTPPKRRHPPQTRLVLHFDINETILLGDDAGGDTRQDSIEKMIAKSAFVRMTDTGDRDNDVSASWDYTQGMEPTHWWDGQKIGHEETIPPLYTGWDWPVNCCPYYRTAYKKYSKSFVTAHDGQVGSGRIYLPILTKCEEELSKSHTNHILPAFYKTLYYLLQTMSPESITGTTTAIKESPAREPQRTALPFTVVFRTFGSDVQEIAQMVTDFALGKHPEYPDVYCPQLCFPGNSSQSLYQGRWKRPSSKQATDAIYQLWNMEETKLVASGDAEILQVLDKVSICGIRDDYRYWKQHNFDPTAGKPVWVPYFHCRNPEHQSSSTSSTYDHHLIFDDNIHNLPHDGIVCVRQQLSDGSFVTVDGTTMHTQYYQGVHMVRVPTIEPVLNPRWFIEQISNATNRLQERLTKEDDQEQDGNDDDEQQE
jgi:hypothetical protein